MKPLFDFRLLKTAPTSTGNTRYVQESTGPIKYTPDSKPSVAQHGKRMRYYSRPRRGKEHLREARTRPKSPTRFLVPPCTPPGITGSAAPAVATGNGGGAKHTGRERREWTGRGVRYCCDSVRDFDNKTMTDVSLREHRCARDGNKSQTCSKIQNRKACMIHPKRAQSPASYHQRHTRGARKKRPNNKQEPQASRTHRLLNGGRRRRRPNPASPAKQVHDAPRGAGARPHGRRRRRGGVVDGEVVHRQEVHRPAAPVGVVRGARQAALGAVAVVLVVLLVFVARVHLFVSKRRVVSCRVYIR